MISVLLIGLGRFGKHTAIQLSELGHQVLAVDRDEDRVNDILPYVTSAVIGDSTNENFLKSLGVSNYDLCIVAISGDFQNSLETTALLKDLGAKKVISRAETDIQTRFLIRNGADDVVYPEAQMAKWTAMRYSSSHILDYIQLDDSHSILEVNVPADWVGYTIGELDVRKRFRLNVMGVRSDGHLNLDIQPSTMLMDNMSLLVLGDYRTLQKCFRL